MIGSSLTKNLPSSLPLQIYVDFVESIDGIDNGVDVAGGAPHSYRVTTDLSSRVGRLFPAWNEPQPAELVNECFREAVLLTGGELLERAAGLAKGWWPARSVVEAAYEAAPAVEPSGRIMVLESGGVPWQTHVFDIEKEKGAGAKLLFALYGTKAATRAPSSPHCPKEEVQSWKRNVNRK